MDSLNLKVGSVHLLILFAGLIITGVLAAITWKYRRRPSLEPPPIDPELAAKLAAQEAVYQELRGQLTVLSKLLNSLPLADNTRLTEAMLNGDDLQDFPFARFRTLASEISPAADAAAALVETNIRWLSDLIREIRALRSGMHYDWNKFPRVQYNEVVRVTRRPLQEIVRHLELHEQEHA
ncbi:MAG TPA: hypothetical protein VMD75_07025 [Candidatus Binataceae bacterium]|nr:hypothetical protein [Candidatus Binataceae bacterium]